MTSSSETVLWGHRPQMDDDATFPWEAAKGVELLFTSERVVRQDIAGGEKAFRAVATGLFSGLLLGGLRSQVEDVRAGFAGQFKIDPKRISASIQYSEISRLKITHNQKPAVAWWQFYRGVEPEPTITFPFKMKDHRSAISAIRPLLGDRVEEGRRPIDSATLDEFRQHLAEIGLKVAPLETIRPGGRTPSDPIMTGAIHVLDANYDFVVKQEAVEGVVALDFVFSNVTGKTKPVEMYIKTRKEGRHEVEWRGEKRLAEHCRHDADLNRSILDITEKHRAFIYGGAYWTISGTREKERIHVGSQTVALTWTVHVSQYWFGCLPPIEAFQVMDKMGVLLRSLGA